MGAFHTLALSGGGYKGLYSAKILANMEEKFNCRIAEKFDLIAGTSIGGILAIALALEIPAAEMVELFIKNGKTIFKPNVTSVLGVFKSKYNSEGLKDVLKMRFGDKTVGDLKHRLIVPTINFTKGGPQVIKTRHHKNFIYDHKIKLVDVALMTSAAPTFFPIQSFGNGDFVDGGITANHPGLFACIEAQKFLDINLEDIYQLHIGTMSSKYTSSGKKSLLKSGLLQWKTKLIELIFSCQEQSTDQLVKFLLDERYLSIDTIPSDAQIRSIGLDKVTDKSQNILLQQADISSQAYLGTTEFKKFITHEKPDFIPIPLEGGNE